MNDAGQPFALFGLDAHQNPLQFIGAVVNLTGRIRKPAMVLFPGRPDRRFVEHSHRGSDPVLYGPNGRFRFVHVRILARAESILQCVRTEWAHVKCGDYGAWAAAPAESEEVRSVVGCGGDAPRPAFILCKVTGAFNP